MADYTTIDEVKSYLGGAWAGTSYDAALGKFVTRCSRMFDRETGKPSNYWASATGVTRRYSGSGAQLLDLDEFTGITAVTMSSNQAGTDTQTLTVSDKTSPNYVQVLPLLGPPYNQLFLLRGFLPDVFAVGNILVTGDVATPDEIAHAVTIWAASSWKAREVGWADAAQRPDGPGLLYVKGIPPETKRVIDYFKENGRGPSAALVSGGDTERLSPWLGWRTL